MNAFLITYLGAFLVGGWVSVWSYFAMLQQINLSSKPIDSIPEMGRSFGKLRDVWRRYNAVAPNGIWRTMMAGGVSAQIIGFLGLIITFSALPSVGSGR